MHAIAWLSLVVLQAVLACWTIGNGLISLVFALVACVFEMIADAFDSAANAGLAAMQHVSDAGRKWVAREKAR